MLVIVGPTASGKSDLALTVGRALGGEIVSTDSMQVYEGMEIGTAAPSVTERAAVPHHLIGIWPPTHSVAVAEFQQVARAAIDDVLARKVLPIVVGGSGLYVSGVLDDLQFPGTDPHIRSALEADLNALGPQEMHERLAILDPASAKQILSTNGRRIVRALEVIEITGRPFTATLPEPISIYPTVRIGLDVPRPELDIRIAERVEWMWENGFVAEVTRLHTDPPTLGLTASRALGYQQIMAFLNGKCSEQEAKSATILATRKFARRQQRWFRRDRRITWIGYDDPSLIRTTIDAAMQPFLP